MDKPIQKSYLYSSMSGRSTTEVTNSSFEDLTEAIRELKKIKQGMQQNDQLTDLEKELQQEEFAFNSTDSMDSLNASLLEIPSAKKTPFNPSFLPSPGNYHAPIQQEDSTHIFRDNANSPISFSPKRDHEYIEKIQHENQLLKSQIEQKNCDIENCNRIIANYKQEYEELSKEFYFTQTALQEAQQNLNELRLFHDSSKKKFLSQEEDFKLFSAKFKALTDVNTTLESENESLRRELRRMQYETPSVTSEGIDFYKDKLEQMAFDNEALKNLSKKFYSELAELKANRYSPPNGNSYSPDRVSVPLSSHYSSMNQEWQFNPADISRSPSAMEQHHQNQHYQSVSPIKQQQLQTVSPLKQQQFHAASPIKQYYDNNPSSIVSSPTSKSAMLNSNSQKSTTFSAPSSPRMEDQKQQYEAELSHLLAEKQKYQAEYQRVPRKRLSRSFGGGRGQEEIEESLDAIEKRIGSVRMEMRRKGML